MQAIYLSSLFLFLLIVSSTSTIYAEEMLSWKSEFNVGFLRPSQNQLSLTISTISENSLYLEWKKPSVSKGEKISGFDIFRKSTESDFKLLKHVPHNQTNHLDSNLMTGFYDYQVIPVINRQTENIPSHGISRHHTMFDAYLKGQQLLAEYKLRQDCIQCDDESFKEIDEIFEYTFPTNSKRDSISHQTNLEQETFHASLFFESLFNIENNHK